jgi:hypothetical protein
MNGVERFNTVGLASHSIQRFGRGSRPFMRADRGEPSVRLRAERIGPNWENDAYRRAVGGQSCEPCSSRSTSTRWLPLSR